MADVSDKNRKRRRLERIGKKIRKAIMLGVLVLLCSAVLIVADAVFLSGNVEIVNNGGIILPSTQSGVPSVEPTGTATAEPSIRPSVEPSVQPSFEPSVEPSPSPQIDKVIVIDPGHGGDSDPGCIYGGYEERDITLSIALKTRDKLLSMGYTVVMTREEDVGLVLESRPQKANDIGADLFVSIHINALNDTSYSGVETWYNEKLPQSAGLALAIQNEVYFAAQSWDRGIKADPAGSGLVVTRETDMPSCLVECGYLSNPDERDRLISKTYQTKIADAIATGIHKYFS